MVHGTSLLAMEDRQNATFFGDMANRRDISGILVLQVGRAAVPSAYCS